ncbi:DUF1835 domain-containing protein [Thalassobacillus hwangdonensis]|uniref:DUF1835 domain-containing protein n=1 Tax=Thalassobacillus hwangdonensis TaxID=546108 RepID=A0ABW3L2Q5_9BACI
MIDKWKKVLEGISEAEAKTMLLHIKLGLDRTSHPKYGNDGFVRDVERSFDDLERVYEAQFKPESYDKYRRVHLTFGASSAGSLKHALRNDDKEKVIGLDDKLSIGPLTELHTVKGREQRIEWLKNHINYDEEYIDRYLFQFDDTLRELQATPEDMPIYIWMTGSANEQIGLRFIMKLFEASHHPIFVMDAVKGYFQEYQQPNIDFTPQRLGEISPDKLHGIFEHVNADPLTVDKRVELVSEWQELSIADSVLRISEDGEIKQVSEAYFDEALIEVARELHSKKGYEFIRAARIIGQVLGEAEQDVSDAYLEYRLRTLVLDGLFEVKGIMKGMRFYEVKLKENSPS